MLTRAFLLLLALMSGLSAAQAADGARAGQAAEIATSLQTLAQVEASPAEMAMATRPQQQRLRHADITVIFAWTVTSAPHATLIPTRLSDRLRA
jgi:hypothetical protein